MGGVFGAIGGAVTGASSGTAALLAQCIPGSYSGNACINQMGSINAYVSNNAYIDAITPPSSALSSTYLFLAGDFANIRNASVSTGKMLAKCQYTGTSFITACNSYLTGTGNNANAAMSAVDYFNSQVSVGGLFT